MAALVWYLTNALVGGTHQGLSETSPGADATSSPNYGWTVGTTAAGNYSSADANSEVTGFGATIQPDGSIVTTLSAGDCWRTDKPYHGTFAAGNWAFQMAVIAVSLGGTQDGNAGFRLFRSVNADGSGATEITAGRLEGGAVTNLSAVAQQVSLHNSTSIGSFSLADEYVFIQIGWEITGAGSMAAADVIHRIGTTASLVTSTDFTPTPERQGPNSGATFASAAPGDIAWTSPGNADVSDEQFAQAIFTAVADQTSESLNATNFGFSIPAGAPIIGIRAEYERKTSVAGVVRDLSVRIIKGGAISGDEKADLALDWPTTDTYKTYGGAADLWGLTWLSSDINATNFGVQLRATNFSGVAGTAGVDHVRLTVWFVNLVTGQTVQVTRRLVSVARISQTLAFEADPTLPASTFPQPQSPPRRRASRAHLAPSLFFLEFFDSTAPTFPQPQPTPRPLGRGPRFYPYLFMPELFEAPFDPATAPLSTQPFALRIPQRLRAYPYLFFEELPPNSVRLVVIATLSGAALMDLAGRALLSVLATLRADGMITGRYTPRDMGAGGYTERTAAATTFTERTAEGGYTERTPPATGYTPRSTDDTDYDTVM